jgi:hypothetical protein
MTRKNSTGARGAVGVAALMAALAGSAAMLQSGESQAQASAPYGCACLHNSKVATTINYRYRWGNGEWKKVSLPQGRNETMCWTYKDAPKSPELLFQLDVDMTSNAKWETFSIKRAQAKAVACSATSAHYHVGYVANSNKKKIQIYNGKD